MSEALDADLAVLAGANAYHRGFGLGGGRRYRSREFPAGIPHALDGLYRDGWLLARKVWLDHTWATAGRSNATRKEEPAAPHSRPRPHSRRPR